MGRGSRGREEAGDAIGREGSVKKKARVEVDGERMGNQGGGAWSWSGRWRIDGEDDGEVRGGERRAGARGGAGREGGATVLRRWWRRRRRR